MGDVGDQGNIGKTGPIGKKGKLYSTILQQQFKADGTYP